MKVYQTKIKKLPGTNYKEVYSLAFAIFRQIKSKSKRKPYVRSAYFKKAKIFIDYFWEHIHQKSWKDRVRRLKYYPCAIDLIKNTMVEPVSKQNPNRADEILHRFAGITKESDLFFIQIKEDKKTGQKYFMSVFPEN